MSCLPSSEPDLSLGPGNYNRKSHFAWVTSNASLHGNNEKHRFLQASKLTSEAVAESLKQSAYVTGQMQWEVTQLEHGTCSANRHGDSDCMQNFCFLPASRPPSLPFRMSGQFSKNTCRHATCKLGYLCRQ